MSGEHSIFPPSGAAAWSKCAQWVHMNQRFPQTIDSDVASEGTAAHWVAWEMLRGETPLVGTKSPNGQYVTEEMLESAELICDTIRDRMKFVTGDCHIEEGFKISAIHPQCFGTPDYWGYNRENCHIEIVDYKYGHRFVDEYFNLQGLCYAVGVLEKLYEDFPPVASVSFTIVQPRCYNRGASVRTHHYSLSEARTFIQHLHHMAMSASSDSPVATTNEHCSDCPGRHCCPALQEAAYSDAEFASSRNILELSPAAAGLELRFLMRALDRLEARVDGLKEQTIAYLKAGKQVPYFRVESGFGRKQWIIPNDQVISIGKLFGHDLSKSEVVTPTQAQKLGVDETVIKANSFTPSTSTKLVVVNPNDAARVFGRAQ